MTIIVRHVLEPTNRLKGKNIACFLLVFFGIINTALGQFIIEGDNDIVYQVKKSLNSITNIKTGNISGDFSYVIFNNHNTINFGMYGWLSVDFIDVSMPDGKVFRFIEKDEAYVSTELGEVFYKICNTHRLNNVTLSMVNTNISSTLNNQPKLLSLNSNKALAFLGNLYAKELEPYGKNTTHTGDKVWIGTKEETEDLAKNTFVTIKSFGLTEESINFIQNSVERIRTYYASQTNDKKLKNENFIKLSSNSSNGITLSSERSETSSTKKTTSNNNLSSKNESTNNSKSSSSESKNTQISKKEESKYQLTEYEKLAIQMQAKSARKRVQNTNTNYVKNDDLVRQGKSILQQSQAKEESIYQAASVLSNSVNSLFFSNPSKNMVEVNGVTISKKDKKIMDELEQERTEKQRERQRNILKNSRLRFFDFFPSGNLPSISKNYNDTELYYFAYCYKENELTYQTPHAKISNIFSIRKFSDGTWLLEQEIKEKISSSLTSTNYTICGPFNNSSSALTIQQSFKKNIESVDMYAKLIQIPNLGAFTN